MLNLTLQNGADVRSTDSYNGTGLIRAADRGHVGVIKVLLQTDIAVNHVNPGLFHVLTFRPTRVSARRTEAP